MQTYAYYPKQDDTVCYRPSSCAIIACIKPDASIMEKML